MDPASPSPDLIAATQAFHLRFEWGLERIRREPRDYAQARMTAEDIEEFLEQWAPQIPDGEAREPLAAMRETAASLRRALHRAELERLHVVLEAREQWHTSELFLQMAVAIIGLFREAPPALLPGLQAAYSGDSGRPFDAEESYREAEADVERDETTYRRIANAFAADFPDFDKPELREKLDKVTLDGCRAWRQRVAGDLIAFAAA
jgi:hypothetical protein